MLHRIAPFGFAVLTITLASVASAAELPNIVLMMGDDHGWEETGYNGHPHVKTPVLDEMAAQGLNFEHFYAGHPNCSPTRASFLTGRHPNRMGTFTPGWSLRPEEITIAHIARQAGYRTGHFGKWHVGAVKAASPVSPGGMGFDEWLSHDNFFELNPHLSRNGGAPVLFPGESSEILVREAIDFIDRSHAAGKPSLTVIWFGSPHEPYSGLPHDLALYDDLPAKYDRKVKLTSNETGEQVTRSLGEVLRERYAEITAMDRAIGRLRKHLTEAGLRDNTIVFYCGDNGTSPDASLASPHRGVKSEIYEAGTLVPGLLEWPAKIQKPRRVTMRASTSDLLPTLCSLVNQPLPDRPLDGINLAAVLDEESATSVRPQPLAFWMYDVSRFDGITPIPYLHPALQEGTTPLVKKLAGKLTRDFTNYRQPPIDDVDYRGPRSIIVGDEKLVLQEVRGKLQRELFDLSTDPGETKNLAEEHPARADELAAQLKEWQTSVLQSLQGADY